MNLPKQAVQQGAAAGAIVVILKMVAYVLGIESLMSGWVGLGQFLLVVVGMALACKATRKEEGDSFPFRRAFWVAFAAAAVATLIALAMDIVLGTWIDPELGAKMVRFTMEKFEASGLLAIIPEEELEKTMADAAWAMEPAGQVFSWSVGLLFWALVALVVGAITKRDDPATF